MSDPASIDQQLKRAHLLFKEQREEIEFLKFQINRFKTGVSIFKCSNCGDSVGPVYNVDLLEQIKEAEKVIEHFVDDAPSNWSDHYRPAKEYLEKYK